MGTRDLPEAGWKIKVGTLLTENGKHPGMQMVDLGRFELGGLSRTPVLARRSIWSWFSRHFRI